MLPTYMMWLDTRTDPRLRRVHSYVTCSIPFNCMTLWLFVRLALRKGHRDCSFLACINTGFIRTMYRIVCTCVYYTPCSNGWTGFASHRINDHASISMSYMNHTNHINTLPAAIPSNNNNTGKERTNSSHINALILASNSCIKRHCL
jgi:hypothetical protein